MNIAMLSVHTCPLAALGGKETGGMNVYVRELTRELARRGHRVDIFTRSQNPEIPHIEMDGLGPGADVFHIPAGPEAPYDKRRLFHYLPEFVKGVRDFAASERVQYDVYHSHYWLSGWVARELQKYQPAPIVQMFHTLGEMKNAAARTEADREIERRVDVEHDIMHYADRLVAATPRDAQQMVDLYGAAEDKIKIIPPGVDLALFQPISSLAARDYIEMPYDHRNILFVGRIDPIKGLDVWFKAIQLIVEQDSELREKLCVCLIGGDLDEETPPDAELARLQTLKDELGIGDVVMFLGKRSQECLPYYYSAADLVVMPSRYESFGMVALEAMACGTPVVASDVGGLSFVVRDGETGYLVPEGNPYALADCVGYLLHHPELRAYLGKRGIEVARQYAWPRIADEIEALYETVIEEKNKLATA